MRRRVALSLGCVLLASNALACSNEASEDGGDESALDVDVQVAGNATIVVDAPDGLTKDERRALEDNSYVNITGNRFEFGKPVTVQAGRPCVTMRAYAGSEGGSSPEYSSTRCFDLATGKTLHVRPTTLTLSVAKEKLIDDFGAPAQVRLDGALTINGSYNAPTWHGYTTHTNEAYDPPPTAAHPQKFVTFGGPLEIKMGFGIVSDMTTVLHEASYTIPDDAPLAIAFDPPELRGAIRIDAPQRSLKDAFPSANTNTVTLEPQRGSTMFDRFNGTRTLHFFPDRPGVPRATSFRFEVNGTSFSADAPAAGATTDVPLRRLDVHDLKDANGHPSPGTYTVDWYANQPGTLWVQIPRYQASMPTNTGLDVVAGHYSLRILSGALGASPDVDL